MKETISTFRFYICKAIIEQSFQIVLDKNKDRCSKSKLNKIIKSILEGPIKEGSVSTSFSFLYKNICYNEYYSFTNTGSIGVSACCNMKFNLSTKVSPYPLTLIQFKSICKLCSELCKKYKISVDNIFTHYGFDLAHNIKQGKVDITYLPFKPELNPIQVQNYFRTIIKNYCKLL